MARLRRQVIGFVEYVADQPTKCCGVALAVRSTLAHRVKRSPEDVPFDHELDNVTSE
jgi:hypothetical protein